VDILEHRHQLGQVEPRRPVGRDAEHPAVHLAAVTQPLQVQEPAGALEVGQRGGIDLQQPLELRPAGQLPFEGIEKLRIMALQNPEQVGDVAAVIVDDLRFRLIVRRKNTPPMPTKASA